MSAVMTVEHTTATPGVRSSPHGWVKELLHQWAQEYQYNRPGIGWYSKGPQHWLTWMLPRQGGRQVEPDVTDRAQDVERAVLQLAPHHQAAVRAKYLLRGVSDRERAAMINANGRDQLNNWLKEAYPRLAVSLDRHR